MILDSEIIEYMINNHTNEYLLIERTMINYYHSRLNCDKSDDCLIYQTGLYDGVLELLSLLSKTLVIDMGSVLTHDVMLKRLIKIYIKT